MILNDSLLQSGEKIVFTLRALYARAGYIPYRMSKFEEYDFYARNKDFLVSDNVITFTDTDGKLLALKPDVTLSIVKNSKDQPDQKQKVFYSENVYRVSKGTNSFQEIMQTGLECIGKVEYEDIREVISLAVESLAQLTDEYMLDISHLSLVANLLDGCGFAPEIRAELFQRLGERNRSGFYETARSCGLPEDKANALASLLFLHGPLPSVNGALTEALRPFENVKGALAFSRVIDDLSRLPMAAHMALDFSVTDDIHYYNGIIFKGFASGIPTAVLSGGQYDHLMQKLSKRSKAIGFAIYTDLLDRVVSDKEPVPPRDNDGYLNIALPKGRLGEKVYQIFAQAGFDCPSILEQNRKLIFENEEKKLRFFWVKPSDVAIYVERGAADIGVAGKDILLEYLPEVYELLDLNTGKCRMAVAAPVGFRDNISRTLRVATKFPVIAQNYYRSLGRDIDIIQLNGSIEIAPILGLSDVIVDIVETGTTLKENHLEVMETVVPISARLIANKSSFKFKSDIMETIVEKMSGIVSEK